MTALLRFGVAALVACSCVYVWFAYEEIECETMDAFVIAEETRNRSTATSTTHDFDALALDATLIESMRPFIKQNWYNTVSKVWHQIDMNRLHSNCNLHRNILDRARIAVCSTMRYESLYVMEFVVHHYRIGVSEFHLFSDNEDDPFERARFREQLKPLIERGIVFVYDSDNKIRIPIDTETVELVENRTQALFTTQCNRLLARERFDWVLNIDADEFVMPQPYDSDLASRPAAHADLFCLDDALAQFRQRHPIAAALLLSRKTFTYSGHTTFDPLALLRATTTSNADAINKTIDDEELLVDRWPSMLRFTRSLPTNTVKSIVRPTLVRHCHSAHQCVYIDVHVDLSEGKQQNATHTVTLVGRNFDGAQAEQRLIAKPLFKPLFLAHYRGKSVSECIWKTVRGYRWMDDKQFAYCAQLDGARDVSAKYWAKHVIETVKLTDRVPEAMKKWVQ